MIEKQFAKSSFFFGESGEDQIEDEVNSVSN